MSSLFHRARHFMLPAICSTLLLLTPSIHAEQRLPTVGAAAASAPAKSLQRQTLNSRPLAVCDPGATATRPSTAANESTSKGSTASWDPCLPQEDIESFLDREFLNFHTNALARVEIYGHLARNNYTVCIGRDCERFLTSLAATVERAANLLGGWKEEIRDAVSPKLPRCATVAPTNNATVDQDKAVGYFVAQDAVLVAYGGGLHTIAVGSRVDVRYNVGGTYTFWITDINADARTVKLSDPSQAKAGGPCA